MPKESLYLACIHDRHTDDVYNIFRDEDAAKRWCKKQMSSFTNIQINQQHRDWCAFVSDSYYAFVQEVDVLG